MKKQLRSSFSTQGRRMAGARALWAANGMKKNQMGKPIIAIVNSFTQFVPGHVHLHEIGQLVKAEIEKLIHDFSANGISVLFISSEMAELVRNCDRILVLRDGKAMGELSGGDISEKSIMETIATGKEK